MDRNSGKFAIVEHTADIGITVYGKTLNELFANAAYGMFSQMADIEKVKPKEKIEVKVQGYDQESLLVNWLNELLYISTIRRMFFSEFKLRKIRNNSLSAEIRGQKIDPKKHSLHLEVKAATYHNLKIVPPFGGIRPGRKKTQGYQTTIIFDV